MTTSTTANNAYDTIQHGDRVTIETKHGNEVTGRATINGPCGWVLAVGRYGQPAIATPDNTVRVKKAKQTGRDRIAAGLDAVLFS